MEIKFKQNMKIRYNIWQWFRIIRIIATDTRDTYDKRFKTLFQELKGVIRESKKMKI